MEAQRQNELFADLNPPKVIQSFVWGNSIVTLTESFFTNNQLEVYNVETKQTSSELVMVTHPIDRKNWQLAAINRDVNVLISGFVYELDRYILQVYILRKVIKDSASGNTNYGFHFSRIRAHENFQVISKLFGENCRINQTPSGETYFLGPDSLRHSRFFKQKMRDLPTMNNVGGGGLFAGVGGAGGNKPKGPSLPEKQLIDYVELPPFEGQAFLRYCSTMIADGKLYVFGGETRKKEVLSELWVFNTKTEKWADLSSKNGDMLKRTGAVMYSNGNCLYICGGQDSNQALCNNFIEYNVETDIWKIFKVDPSSEPIHSCLSLLNELLIIRGRATEIAKHHESKPCFEISGGHKNEAQDNTLQDYRKLFRDMPYHDVIFKVESQEIPAHRALLSIRCPHFLQVFPASLKDPSNKVIEVPNIKAVIFKGLLEYLYCGEIPQDEETVIELLKALEAYQIEELREKCQDYLAFNLRIDNVAKLATLARSYKADQLKTAILKFIKANESKLDVGDLNQFDKDFLIEIFMFKQKNICSYDLFICVPN